MLVNWEVICRVICIYIYNIENGYFEEIMVDILIFIYYGSFLYR